MPIGEHRRGDLDGQLAAVAADHGDLASHRAGLTPLFEQPSKPRIVGIDDALATERADLFRRSPQRSGRRRGSPPGSRRRFGQEDAVQAVVDEGSIPFLLPTESVVCGAQLFERRGRRARVGFDVTDHEVDHRRQKRRLQRRRGSQAQPVPEQQRIDLRGGESQDSSAHQHPDGHIGEGGHANHDEPRTAPEYDDPENTGHDHDHAQPRGEAEAGDEKEGGDEEDQDPDHGAASDGQASLQPEGRQQEPNRDQREHVLRTPVGRPDEETERGQQRRNNREDGERPAGDAFAPPPGLGRGSGLGSSMVRDRDHVVSVHLALSSAPMPAKTGEETQSSEVGVAGMGWVRAGGSIPRLAASRTSSARLRSPSLWLIR